MMNKCLLASRFKSGFTDERGSLSIRDAKNGKGGSGKIGRLVERVDWEI